MSTRIKETFRKALRLLPLLGVALLCSCYEDEADECPDSGAPVTVQFKITAENADDLNGTRAEEYEVGKDHEYISNLCVLIVQNNVVVEKLLLTDFEGVNETDAELGNIRSCTSRELELDPGTYDIYAFANLNTAYNEEWTSLTELGEGKSLTQNDINIDNIVLDDPAGKLDFSKSMFIPMSAKETVSVNSSTGLISIGLDRLVSKVRIAVTGPVGKEITSLTFSGTANKVALFADNDVTKTDGFNSEVERIFSEEKTFLDDEDNNTGTVSYDEFYVNATPVKEEGFTVELTTNEDGGTTYISTTTRDELPRNSIYPLNIKLNPYGLVLSGKCSVAPIGNFPVYFNAVFSHDDTYEVKLPEGSQFTFTIEGVTLNDVLTSEITSYNWNIDESLTETGFKFTSVLTGKEVSGHVTASVGQDFPFTAEVHWTNNGNYTRIYTVNVHTTDITDVDPITGEYNPSALSRSAVWGEIPAPELLNVFRKKN